MISTKYEQGPHCMRLCLLPTLTPIFLHLSPRRPAWYDVVV
jgi:hypothetical protein